MRHLPFGERCGFLALALALVAWLPPAVLTAPPACLTPDAMKRASVVGADGVTPKDVRVVCEWAGPVRLLICEPLSP